MVLSYISASKQWHLNFKGCRPWCTFSSLFAQAYLSSIQILELFMAFTKTGPIIPFCKVPIGVKLWHIAWGHWQVLSCFFFFHTGRGTNKRSKLGIIFHLSMKTYVVGTHLNHPNETVQVSTHNICFHWKIRKIILQLSAIYSSYLVYWQVKQCPNKTYSLQILNWTAPGQDFFCPSSSPPTLQPKEAPYEIWVKSALKLQRRSRLKMLMDRRTAGQTHSRTTDKKWSH